LEYIDKMPMPRKFPTNERLKAANQSGVCFNPTHSVRQIQ
jgi:hypothetical protein